MEFMPRETVDFVVNMTYHDVTHKAENYELLIHELAHNVVRSKPPLCRILQRGDNTGCKAGPSTGEAGAI